MNNKSLITIDDLPFEIFELIVNQLKLKDKLKLPFVSKLWYTKFNNLKITKLYLSEESKNCIPNRFHLNRTEFDQHFFKIDWNEFNLYFTLFKYIELNNLKDLRIFNFSKCPSNFISTLNSIKTLENLLICNIGNLKGSITISLPDLKSFTTDYLYKIQKFEFNTPKLKCFKIDSHEFCHFSVDFKHPDSLEFIQINWYHYKINKFLDKYKFPNLKKLIIRSLAEVSDNFLSNLNQLEEIHIISSEHVFMKIYNQKLKLNLINLKIYYYGLIIENLDNFNKWFRNHHMGQLALDYNLACLYLDNYPKLSNKFILHDVIYYSSFEHLDLEVELWSKFENLNHFYIDKPIKYDDKFLKLSKNKLMENIAYFSICINSDSINLLDKLNLVIPFVQKIRILVEDRNLSDYNYNFKFLFKLKYLVDISVVPKLDYDFLIELYQNLKSIKSLRFYQTSICKRERNLYSLSSNTLREIIEFNSKNDLLEYLKDKI